MIGERLGHFRVTAKIGSGGMGAVYRARDERLHRDVAIKVLSKQAGAPSPPSQLLAEARAASQLNHPHICTVYEVGDEPGFPYIAMELVEGQVLSDMLVRGPLAAERVADLAGQLADGLAHAHAHGVVHADLKSGNIVVTAEGRAKILDFGLARRRVSADLSERTTQATLAAGGTVTGTVPYMAPEQLRGARPNESSDVWSLGVVLYEMAAGTRPFRGQTTFELTSAILNDAPTPLGPEVPVALRRVIERCLEKEPARRFRNGGEVQAALRALRDGAAPIPAESRARRRSGVARAAAIVAALGLGAALGIGEIRERLFGTDGGGRIDALAVIPLESLSGDPESEYFADGMTDALIADLGRIGAIRVISRTSAMRYKRTTKSAREIAADLNVDALVEGTVVHADDRVRVTTRLIDAARDRQIWSDSFERDLRDVLSLQNEIARAIAERIRMALTPQEQAGFGAQRQILPEVYQAYVTGRFHWAKRTPDGISAAIEHFQKAIAIDPGYAPAYAALAACYTSVAFFGVAPAAESIAQAITTAKRAIALDDTVAEAHTALGEALAADRQYGAAEQEYRRGIELNPNYAIGHQWLGTFLSTQGRHAEAAVEARRALELDPVSLITGTALGLVLYYAREYDQAVEEFRKTIDLDQQWPVARQFLAQPLLQLRRHDEAIQELQEAVRLSQDSDGALAFLGYAYGASDRRGEAAEILRRLGEKSRSSYVDPYYVALVQVATGDTVQALESLTSALEEGSFAMTTIKVEPMLDPLRSNPRFQDLLRRMQLQ